MKETKKKKYEKRYNNYKNKISIDASKGTTKEDKNFNKENEYKIMYKKRKYPENNIRNVNIKENEKNENKSENIDKKRILLESNKIKNINELGKKENETYTQFIKTNCQDINAREKSYNNLNSNIKNRLIFNEKYEKSLEGFPNIGNTCYMNSFLQIIIHIPQFISTLKKNEKIFNNDSLIKKLIEVAERPSKENLKNLKKKIGSIDKDYLSYEQEDSQEFGVKLINSLINEEIDNNLFEKWTKPKYTNKSRNERMLKKKLKSLEEFLLDPELDFQNETFIQKIFQFYESDFKLNKLRQINMINFNLEIDNQLSLDLNYREKNDILPLKELLINKYIKTTKKLFKLPKIFIITILRAVIGNNMLNNSTIQFDDELNLEEFMDSDFGDYKEPTEYSLFAINMSSGESRNSGHYYSYIKIKNDWYCFNDKSVSKTIPFFKKEDDKGIFYESQEVYGLFYIRKNNFIKY